MLANEIVNTEMNCERVLVHFHALAVSERLASESLQLLPRSQKRTLNSGRNPCPKISVKNYMSDKIVFTRSCSFRTEPIEFADIMETESSAPLIRVV